jgi:hypothetical protein
MRTLTLSFSMLFICLISSGAKATTVPLENLDQGAFKKVIGNFSANFNHTSVSGAESLGTIFGFEVGLVGGVTNSPDLQSLAIAADSSAKADRLPHGEILGVLTVPAGLTVEAGWLPKVGSRDFQYRTFSAALKWTPTDTLLDWPFNFALKGHVTATSLKFNAAVAGTPTDFDYDGSILGLTALVSENFGIVEPYFGLGVLRAKGTLDAGSSAAFDHGYATASATEKISSGELLLGAEVKLIVVKLGFEYARLFDAGQYNAKLSFYF